MVDAETAWAELCRFADAAGVELDDRAAPGEPAASVDGESEVADYSVVLKAIRDGRIVVHDDGRVVVTWRKAPVEGRATMTLDPGSWPYGLALRALTSNPVGKAARERTATDMVGKANAFLETLARESPRTLERLTHKMDCQLAVHLAGLIASE